MRTQSMVYVCGNVDAFGVPAAGAADRGARYQIHGDVGHVGSQAKQKSD